MPVTPRITAPVRLARISSIPTQLAGCGFFRVTTSYVSSKAKMINNPAMA